MYEIKILSDDEFESLPYPEMDTSLGVADPTIRTAYVRHTGVNSIDAFNMAHELEHLEEGHDGKHADHYRNGVYYKGFSDVFNYASKASAVAAAITPGMQWASPLIWQGGDMAFKTQGAKKEQRHQESLQEQMQQPQSQMQTPSSPMEQFSTPQQSQPNVITPAKFGGGGGEPGVASGGNSVVDKLRQFGFFSGRNVGGF